MLRANAPTSTGRIFTSGAQHVLQKDHLQFHGVLEGVAVVLHLHARAAALGQPVHQRRVRSRIAQRRAERLPRQPELSPARRNARSPGSRTCDPCAPAAASRTPRGSDCQPPSGLTCGAAIANSPSGSGGSTPPMYSRHHLVHFVRFVGVCRPGMRRLAHRGRGELALALRLHALRSSRLPGSPRLLSVSIRFCCNSPTSSSPVMRTSAARRSSSVCCAVEALQTLHQRRRNHQHGVGDTGRDRG